MSALSIGRLREALVTVTELGGSWGGNMHESKSVLLRVEGKVYNLVSVAASFINGSVVLVLDGEAAGEPTT